MTRLILAGALLADVSTATDNTAALYTLVGVIVAALLSTIGHIIVGVVGKKRDAPLDAGPNDVNVLVEAYKDARHDLEVANTRIGVLETELEESRAMADHMMGELAKDRARRRPRDTS